jgi:carbonic anhydrase
MRNTSSGRPALVHPLAEGACTAADVLDRLKEGNVRFVNGESIVKDLPARRTETANVQKPFAVVLACADSRVSPELIFDQSVGDLFVLRVAGNVADAVILGSIEFAVEQLKSPLVAVVGHEGCGAVQAIVSGMKAEGNLAHLLSLVHVGTDLPADRDEAVAAAVAANARFQTAALTGRSELLKNFAASGRIRVIAGVYSPATGKVKWLDEAEPTTPKAK